MTQARYRLVGRLEAGELAELYQAVRDDRDPVLVKLFHPRTSDQRYARLLADAQVQLAGLDDPAIVRLLDLGTVRGRLAAVRELIPGHTLGQALQRLLTRDVLLPPALGLFVVIQLLEAVQRAHEVGVIHGAITPGNVLLGSDGQTALSDFGALAALQAVPQLRTFASKGRGAYRAPELSSGGAPSVVSDVYSLGAIAYELLTLKEAVRASKTVSTRHEPLPPPSRLDRRINARLDPIVMRALELSPQRRFKSCADLSSALRGFVSASGGMPGQAELARVLAELFPGEAPPALGPVPFAEPFGLEELTGVDLSGLEERSVVLTARPSFSGGAVPAAEEDELYGAQTVEGAPAFADYAPGPAVVPASRQPPPAPGEEGTSPGGAGPLEAGWEAPPGQAPKKKPLGAGPIAVSGKIAALKRMRVVEDLSVRLPPSDTEERSEPGPTRLRPRPPPPPPPERHRERREEEEELPPEPGPSGTETRYPLVKEPDGQQRRMITEERSLYKVRLYKRRFLLVSVAVGLVGLFAFALALYRFAPRRSAPSRLAEVAEELPVPPPPQPLPVPQPETRPAGTAAPVRIEAEPEEEAHRPPRKSACWLVVKSSEQAKVFVDGRRVPGYTPLRVKVAAGNRKIVVESVRTGEQKELSRHFAKGKTLSLYEVFDSRGK